MSAHIGHVDRGVVQSRCAPGAAPSRWGRTSQYRPVPVNTVVRQPVPGGSTMPAGPHRYTSASPPPNISGCSASVTRPTGPSQDGSALDTMGGPAARAGAAATRRVRRVCRAPRPVTRRPDAPAGRCRAPGSAPSPGWPRYRAALTRTNGPPTGRRWKPPCSRASRSGRPAWPDPGDSPTSPRWAAAGR